MRLIDADAIEYTHEITRSLDDGHNWNELCITKDEIDDMPTITQSGWIPVYERLPEEEGYYLVWLEHGFFEVVHYWNGYWNAFSHCTKNSLEGVIAWMPTPEPYKEGTE